ncbi:transcriptional regulator [Sulfitobacter sp. JL08]|uniref:helix-turn-helix transcriptional regulator n=1 Tax=Sulfitobacter sp. JL08 TaxID=2070369 RepID=UPI000E09FDA2|nr:YafY family protein [Sulfitobacter sp. JL08]AXI53239.1 transcriptional regulator [Sulfitobacter sp. JL08]
MRSIRMFDIIQLLRKATRPLTAQQMADTLEVTKRTIYRDIAALQSTRVPIEGEAGIGYILRPGFDLPPINFDVEEAEAITVGLSMIARTGDKGLERAAARAARKLSDATQLSETLFSSSWGAKAPGNIDLSAIRDAIRQEAKIELFYCDVNGGLTERTILPVALIYYSEAVVVAAWCEMRGDFRHFRPDRMVACTILSDRFTGKGQGLRREWAAQHAADL